MLQEHNCIKGTLIYFRNTIVLEEHYCSKGTLVFEENYRS
jgi:hypothetical protein